MEPFLKTWLRHAPALAVVMAIVLGLEHYGLLQPVESVGIDRFVRAFPAEESQDIFIVEITDDDYRDAFHNQSPLDAGVLMHLLRNLRDAGTKVIGVDLDTSDTPLPAEAHQWHNVIWAEVPEPGPPLRLHDARNSDRIGIPFFPRDEDGIVRRFEDSFPVANRPQPVPSLSCAIAHAFDPRVKCDTEREHRFSFTGDHFHFQSVPAGEILSEDHPVWRQNIHLENSIVLVGGRYGAARDEYVTPAGELSGVEVVANAAQSYLKGGQSLLDAPWYVGALFDLVIGTLVIWLYWRFRVRVAFVLSISAAPVIAVGISFLAFLTLHYWLGFMPVLVGMVLHEMYDHSEHLEELESSERRAERLKGLFRRRSRYRPRGRSEP